jgi:membrane dipeptidase
MLVVFTISPHFRFCHIIHNTQVGNPDLGLVLTVSQRQLRFAYHWYIFRSRHKLKERPLHQKFYLAKDNFSNMLSRFFTPLFFAGALVWSGCEQKKSVDQMTDNELKAYADELAHKFIIADGHIDLPYLLKEKKFQPGKHSADTLVRTGKGEFDYERSKKGGLDAPFMSIYIPVDDQKKPDMGKGLADSLINMVKWITEQLPDKFVLANTPQEVETNFKAGKVSLPMGMENGAPIGKDLANLKYFFDRGIRYITLTHNADNQICDASNDTTHTWNGLSPFGKEVVAEMNRLGIMVDLSHVDDSTFYQAATLSKAPPIASHSSCKHFSPHVKRDMTDDMIKKMGEADGVILINFFTNFLDSAAYNNRQKLGALLREKDLVDTDSLAKDVIAQFKKDHPNPTTIEKVVDHIDHVVKIAGIDHVGFGSDFDGVDSNLPVGLEDVSKYPNLIYTLLKRGYSEQDIEKICSGNFFRVWNKSIEVAKQMQAGTL